MNRKDRLARLVELERQVERSQSKTEDGWRRLQSSLAGATPPPLVELSSGRQLRLSRAGRWLRLVSIGALGCVAAVGWVTLRHPTQRAVAPEPGAPVLSALRVAEQPLAGAMATPSGSQTPLVAASAGFVDTRARARSPRAASEGVVKSTASAAESRAPAPFATSSRNTFEEELHLIKSAREAEEHGRVGQASALLNQHAQQFPSGVFADEREALRVLAACRTASRAERASLAQRFGRAYPRSPYFDRVKRTCLAPDEN